MAKNSFSFEEAFTPSTFSFEEAIAPPSENRSTRDAADSMRYTEDAQEDQEVITSARAWRGAGAGRGSFADPRRLDQESGRKLQRVEQTLDQLEKINPRSREELRPYAESVASAPESTAKPVDRVQQYTDNFSADQYKEPGGLIESAQKNAAFDQRKQDKTNRTMQARDADPVTGEKIVQSYNPNTESQRVKAEEADTNEARLSVIGRGVAEEFNPVVRGIVKGGVQSLGLGAAAIGYAADAMGADGVKAWGLDVNRQTGRMANQLTLSKNATDIQSIDEFQTWLAENGGYTLYQAAESLLTAGIGGAAGKAIGKEAVGQVVAMTANNIRQTLGSVYAEAVDEAKRTGKPMPSLAQIAAGAVVSGAVDTFADKLGLDALTAAGFKGNALSRLTKSLGTQMGVQGGTEALQVIPESLGAGKDPFTQEGFKQMLDEGAVGALGGGGPGVMGAINRYQAPAPAIPSAEQMARDRGFLTPTVTSFADPNGPASKAGITPIVVPTPQNVSTPSDTGGLATGAGNGGSPVVGPSVGDMGQVGNVERGLGDAAGINQPIGAGDPSLSQPSGEPSSSVNPIKRTADADLLSKVAYEEEGAAPATNATPDSIWTGRSGAGYDTVESAQQAMESRVKRDPELQWKVEQRPDGKYHLAGYSTGDTNGQVRSQAAPVRNSNDLENAGAATGDSQGTTISGGLAGVADTAGRGLAYSVKQDMGDSAAARAKAQASLDYWHGRDPDTHPKVTLGAPEPKADAQIQSAMQQAKELFGVSADVIAFSDPSPDSVNGMEIGGRVYVNTKGVTSNALTTGWHETHHVMQAIEESDTKQGKTNTPAQRYIAKVDAIFDTMGERGKRQYIESFLYKDRLQGLTGERREAAIQKALASKETRKEMMADFVGNRATDRGFIRSLAEADPKNFQQWAKKWLQTINDLIAELRGNGGNKQSKAVDRYVADLNKARMVVRDALVELRNSGQTESATDAETDAQFKRKSGGRSNFEVAPDPNDKELSGKWNAQTEGGKLAVSEKIARQIVPKVLAIRGAIGKIVPQVGSYLNDTNPSFSLVLSRGDLHQISMDLGYVLSQDSMVNISTKPFAGGKKTGAVTIQLGPMGANSVKAIYDKLHAALPNEVGGQSFAEGRMTVLNYSDTPTIDLAVKIFNLLDEKYNVRHDDVYSSFPEKKDYTHANSRTSGQGNESLSGEAVRGRLDSLRAEATKLISEELGAGTSYKRREGRPGSVTTEGDRTTVRGAVHYGKSAGLSTLSGSSSGTGIKGAEQDRLKEATDPRIKKRVYFYLPTQGGIPNPEAGLGQHVYSADLNNLYDPLTASKPIKGTGNALESAVLDAGYSGYVNQAQGTIVALNQDVTVEYLGTSDEFDKTTRAPVDTKPRVMTRTEGDELIRKPDGAEVMQIINVRPKLRFASPSFRMEYGEARVLAVEAGAADAVLADAGSTFQFGKPSYKRRSQDDVGNDIDSIDDLGAFNLDADYANSTKDDFSFPDLSGADARLEAAQMSPQERLNAEMADAELFRRELEQELRAEGFGVAGTVKTASAKEKSFADVKPADIKAAGFMPETAYPDLTYYNSANGLEKNAYFVVGGNRYRATISGHNGPDIDLNAIQANKKGSVRGLPLRYQLGGLSDEAREAWNKRFAASADLFGKGFDLYTSVPKAARDNILATWKKIAENPDTFEFAKAKDPKGKNYKEVAQDIADQMLKDSRYAMTITETNDPVAGSGSFGFTIKDTKTSVESTGDIEFHPQDKEVTVHVSELEKGSGTGKPVYQVAQAFAAVFKSKIEADPQGLLGVNNYRRTEQMFSGALRSGNFDTMQPGVGQRIYGWNERAKTQEQQDRNFVRMALAATRNALEFAPSIKDFGYDLATDKFFVKGKERSFENDMIAGNRIKMLLQNKDARVASISRSTLARAVITLQAIDGRVDVPEDIAKPVLYARRQGPSERKYQENYLVPEVAGEFADDSGNIAVMPGLVFAKDGINRTYPTMPIRVQVGEHMRDPSKVVHQYGLQHRIENKQKDVRRGYMTPEVDGVGTAPEVERAIRDITLGLYEASTVYADNAPRKVYLHAPTIDRMTVLERDRDSTGKEFWNVITSMPQTRADMMRRYKAPTTVGGITYNGERTQQAFDIKRGILNKLKEPGQSPVTSESYILDDDGLLFNQPVAETPKSQSPVRVLARDENGKIILNKRKVDPTSYSRKQAAQGLPEETQLQRVQRVMQDQYNRVKLVQDLLVESGGLVGEEQDVYRAEERMHGRVHELMRQFKDDVVQPFLDKAVAEKVDLNELALYAYAKHAKERNAHIQTFNRNVQTGSGMSDDTANNIIQLVDLSGDRAKFDDLHNDMMAMTATTRRVMLDEGLITQDQYDGLENMYQNYVPLRGFEDVEAETGKVRPGLGRGFNVKGKETIAAMGRDSMAGDIIENIIRDYERVTIRSEKNAVGKTFLDLVQNNPDPNLWEVQPIKRTARKDANGLVQYVNVDDKGEDTVAVKVAGQPVYIKIHDDLLLRAMQNTFKGEKSDSERFVMRAAGMYTSLLRNTITRFNPVFGVINAVRDAQMGAMGVFDALGAEGMKRYVKHYAGAMAAGARTEVNKSDPAKHQMDRWMREMRFAGGTTGGIFMRDNETIRSELRDAMLAAGIAPNGVMDWAKHNSGVRAAKHVLHALEVIGAVSEHAARLSAYASAREMGRTPAEAASIAKNLTVNFNRFGEQGQLINTLFIFYNAAVQGSVRIGQMAKNPKVQAAFAGMAGVGLSLALMGAAVGGDDEDGQPYWDKIPDWEKERNIIIMLPPGWGFGESVGKRGHYVKIPMAYGLNVFPVLGYQMADVIRNIKDPTKGSSVGKAAINMVSAIMGSYNPFGGSLSAKPDATWALAVAPTVADPIIQLSQGVDGFGKPTGPSKSQFDKRPDSEIVSGAQHGKVYHRIARYLNEATGGNQAREGGIDLQPGTIKNIGGIVGGGLGKFVGDMVNLGYLGVQDLPIETRDIPVYKAFYGEYDKKAGMSQYYERSQKAMTEFDFMKNEMKAGVKRDYSAEEKFLQRMGAQAEEMSKALGELKKWEVSIAESDSTDREKEIKRKEVQKVRERLAADYNKRWYREESKLKTGTK